MPTAEHTQRWFRFGADINFRLNRSNDSPDLAHGFVFFVFVGFLEVLAKLQKTMEKQQKKQKVQTHVPCQASPQTLPMGLNFLVFFCILCFFFLFHCCFACFSCEDAFITVPLKKKRVSTICTPAPPRPNCKKKQWKKQNSFIHLYSD